MRAQRFLTGLVVIFAACTLWDVYNMIWYAALWQHQIAVMAANTSWPGGSNQALIAANVRMNIHSITGMIFRTLFEATVTLFAWFLRANPPSPATADTPAKFGTSRSAA